MRFWLFFFLSCLCLWLPLQIRITVAYWIYDYEQVFRDPGSETANNEILKTGVISYFASRKNEKFVINVPNQDDADTFYKFTLSLFDNVTQEKVDYAAGKTHKHWNLGIWNSFVYCDKTETSICMVFDDGQWCANDYTNPRSTIVQLSCDATSFATALPNQHEGLFDMAEEENNKKCHYSSKLYFPELCQAQEHALKRDSGALTKIQEMSSAYISKDANLVSTAKTTIPLPLPLHGSLSVDILIDEINDVLRICLQGPIDKYFAIGFGSDQMSNTYAIVIHGHSGHSKHLWFEQLLGPQRSKGLKLESSLVLESSTVAVVSTSTKKKMKKKNKKQRKQKNSKHGDKEAIHFQNQQQSRKVVLSRKLSSAVEIDDYWLFSTLNKEIEVVWAVGKSHEFAHHLFSGSTVVTYTVQTKAARKARMDAQAQTADSYSTTVNWPLLAIIGLCIAVGNYYCYQKWKESRMDRFVPLQSLRRSNSSSSSGLGFKYGTDDGDDHSSTAPAFVREQDFVPLLSADM